jgi:hypothetical protein
MSGDLSPGTDPYPVRLGDRKVGAERMRRRLAVAPHALFERALKLGLVRRSHELGALVVKSRIEEEAVMFELEMLLGLADTTLAQGQ